MKRFFHIDVIGYENIYFENYDKELENIAKESGKKAAFVPLTVSVKLCETKYGDKYLVKNFYKSANGNYYFYNDKCWETLTNRADVSNDIVKRETIKTWQFSIDEYEMLVNALTKRTYK